MFVIFLIKLFIVMILLLKHLPLIRKFNLEEVVLLIWRLLIDSTRRKKRERQGGFDGGGMEM